MVEISFFSALTQTMDPWSDQIFNGIYSLNTLNSFSNFEFFIESKSGSWIRKFILELIFGWTEREKKSIVAGAHLWDSDPSSSDHNLFDFYWWFFSLLPCDNTWAFILYYIQISLNSLFSPEIWSKELWSLWIFFVLFLEWKTEIFFTNISREYFQVWESDEKKK